MTEENKSIDPKLLPPEERYRAIHKNTIAVIDKEARDFMATTYGKVVDFARVTGIMSHELTLLRELEHYFCLEVKPALPIIPASINKTLAELKKFRADLENHTVDPSSPF